ncbi:MAG: hypothetical protein JNM70_22270 [Anaerolineae bacterium]|nr:hypothetical protein [Anaerolineae bacterium]
MSVRIDWFDETKTIVFWQFSGRWNLNDLLTVYDEACQLCDTVPDRWVQAIVDMRDTSMMPNLISSSVATRATRDPRNYDMAFVVTSSGFFQAIVNILNRLAGSKGKFQIASSIEAAQEAIAERRKTLPPLSEMAEP